MGRKKEEPESLEYPLRNSLSDKQSNGELRGGLHEEAKDMRSGEKVFTGEKG